MGGKLRANGGGGGGQRKSVLRLFAAAVGASSVLVTWMANGHLGRIVKDRAPNSKLRIQPTPKIIKEEK